MKVLIVEDNQRFRQIMIHALRPHVDEILECSDGAEAVISYAEHQPDVVFMDIRMPKKDGLTATRDIIAQYPDARIIIVTDYGDAELRQAANEAGAIAYVLKDNLLKLREFVSKPREK
jgi:CheY-like chemotaxis protein